MATALGPYEVLRSTPGKANFQRVARLLISGGTVLMREIFDHLCPPPNLPTVLQNAATKKQLARAKLTKPQWDCLYPSPGVCGESKDFDVTLLFRLLRTICNLIPPATGWDALPANTDHSLAADLTRVKYYRNSVYAHVNQNMDITDAEFQWLWQEISEALVRIAGQISTAKKNDWQVAVISFLTDPLTAEDERNVRELKEWYKTDMELKDFMEKFLEEMERLRETITNDSLEKCPACGVVRPRVLLQYGSEESSAPLRMTIDCVDIMAEHDSLVGPRPTTQDVLNLAASKYLDTINPSEPEEFNGFVHYLERVRKVLIVDTQPGSLIITVKCISLKSLQELWDDYCMGLVNRMAEKFLVTKVVLNKLNLMKAKLTTTIPETEYRACQNSLKLYSELKRLKEHRDEFQKQFLDWAHTRKRTRAFLAEFVEMLHSPSVPSFLTILSTIAGPIAGPIVRPIAVVADGWAAVFGRGTSETVTPKRTMKNKTITAIEQDQKACEELRAKMGSFEKCITNFAIFCREHVDLVLSSRLADDEFGFLLDILRRKDRGKTKTQASTVPVLSTLLQEDVNAILLNKIVNTPISTATNLEISNTIQDILTQLQECPDDEQIKTMTVNFIKEIFKSCLDTKATLLGLSREQQSDSSDEPAKKRRKKGKRK